METETKMVLLYSFMGLLVGVLSPKIGVRQMLVLGIVLLIGLGEITDRVIHKKTFSWWFGNGAWPYLAMWFATWVIIHNAV